ncbi:MAG: hypothetical protein AABZ39_10820 [Spirochaetota bacterium]
MPNKEVILSGLAGIASQYSTVAIAWHIAIYVFILLLVIGLRPPKRLSSIMATMPLLSVAVFAFLAKNPFTAIVLGAASLLLMMFGILMPKGKVKVAINPNLFLGIPMLLYGLVYPHFLENIQFFQYAIMAPVGLVPCPTLSTVIGLALFMNAFGSKKWPITLSVFGLFYGLFGVFRLGVMLDIGLILGSIGLLISAIIAKKET